MSAMPIVVLLSGAGSNLQAIIDAIATGTLPVTIKAVISNKPDAPGLARAAKQNIDTVVLSPTQFDSRAKYDNALMAVIDRFAPKLVVLAGFMRILSEPFVRHYRGRLINIHPSLLPKYKGIATHEKVLAAGETEHGCSIHFVTEALDSGPVISQARLTVSPNDTAKSLATRVHTLEHSLYPKVIGWFCEGRVTLENHRVYLDGKPLA
jgi:phosphoribosylglycinamide formyltransferase 1